MTKVEKIIKIIDLPCPNDAYFRQSEVKPYIKGDTLYISYGRGSDRSWGHPYCYSDVRALSENIIEVSIRWGNKHAWGKANYYFVKENGVWTERKANYKPVKRLITARKVLKALSGV